MHALARALTLITGLAITALLSPAASARQGANPPSPDAQRAERLLAEVARLQQDAAKLKQRIAQLERENADLKAALQAAGGDKRNPAPKPGSNPGSNPGTGGTQGDHAPLPNEPLAAPQAALAAFAADYTQRITETPTATPAERQKTVSDVGAWVRSSKKYRGRVEWTIRVKELEPDPLKGGGTLRFTVVHPVDKRPYSDLIVSQPLTQAQWRALNDRADATLWKLVGQFSAEPRFNKDLEDPASTPMFIGPFAEMSTTLTVQTLSPLE